MDDWNSMDWDFGDSGGGDYGGDFGDFGYQAPATDFPVALSPLLGLGGNPFSMPMQQPGAPQAQQQAPMPPMGIPQQGTPQGMMQQSPFGGLGGLQSLLGLGAMGAGLAGTLAGGGRGTSITPQMSPQMQGVGQQANVALQGLNPFAQGLNPMQMQQQSLLSALASGQGLPPGYAQLVEQAFQPQMGNIATQAIESARRRGFAGGAELLQQAPAGAIAGPVLADLQGQMAQAKLGLMQSLPGLYNTPIQTQGNFAGQQAQGFQNLFRSYPVGQQQSAPMGPQIGQAIGQGLAGMGQSIGQGQQDQQRQQMFNQMMQLYQQRQPGGMSYTTPGMYP